MASISAPMRAIPPGPALVIAAAGTLAGIVLCSPYGTDTGKSLFLPELGEKSGLPADAGLLTFAKIPVWLRAATVGAGAASFRSTCTGEWRRPPLGVHFSQ